MQRASDGIAEGEGVYRLHEKRNRLAWRVELVRPRRMVGTNRGSCLCLYTGSRSARGSDIGHVCFVDESPSKRRKKEGQ